jgi:hypothetical protein
VKDRLPLLQLILSARRMDEGSDPFGENNFCHGRLLLSLSAWPWQRFLNP